MLPKNIFLPNFLTYTNNNNNSIRDKCIKMVNFMLSNEMGKDEMINISSTRRAWDDIDSVDPSSIQDACHTWTQLTGLALHEFS